VTGQDAAEFAGGDDEDLARAIALSMEDAAAGSQLHSEAAAVAALTQMQEGGSGAGAASGVSLEEQQLQQALALSMETATQDAQTRSRRAFFTHYNGLAPHYMQMERMRVGLAPSTVRVVDFEVDLLGGDSSAAEVSSPEQNVNAARKIQQVLQHRPLNALASKDEGPFEYLVVCDRNGSMEGRARPRAPGKWRCRDCHLQVGGCVCICSCVGVCALVRACVRMYELSLHSEMCVNINVLIECLWL
jgi:hypothetical protein